MHKYAFIVKKCVFSLKPQNMAKPNQKSKDAKAQRTIFEA